MRYPYIEGFTYLISHKIALACERDTHITRDLGILGGYLGINYMVVRMRKVLAIPRGRCRVLPCSYSLPGDTLYTKNIIAAKPQRQTNEQCRIFRRPRLVNRNIGQIYTTICLLFHFCLYLFLFPSRSFAVFTYTLYPLPIWLPCFIYVSPSTLPGYPGGTHITTKQARTARRKKKRRPSLRSLKMTSHACTATK